MEKVIKYNIDGQSKELDSNTTIKNVGEWIEIVNSLNTNMKMPLLYRGHCSADFDLSPSVIREDKLDEKAILNDYLHNVDLLGLRSNERMIRHLINMQHNEIPTRLMDWSLNPLIALFFACYDERGTEKGMNASIHIADPWLYNSMVIGYSSHPEIHDINIDLRCLLAQGYSNDDKLKLKIQHLYPYIPESGSGSESESIIDKAIKKLKYPIFLIGDYTNKRTVIQQAAYSLDGLNESHEDKKFDDKLKKLCDATKDSEGISEDCVLRKVIIDKDSKQNILNELARLGITPYTVYPDFSGFKRTLAYKEHSKKSLYTLIQYTHQISED